MNENPNCNCLLPTEKKSYGIISSRNTKCLQKSVDINYSFLSHTDQCFPLLEITNNLFLFQITP